MSRRVASAAVLMSAAVLLLAAVPASAQTTDIGDAPVVAAFGHDDALDGTPNERVSGFFGGEDGDNSNGDALADRTPLTWEAFEFSVPPGVRSARSPSRWPGRTRAWTSTSTSTGATRATGVLAPASIASSASFGDTDESATYYNALASDPVEPGDYVVVVDNWCTSNTDPGATFADCGIADGAGNPTAVPDEDDFVGTVTFGPELTTNALPGVALAGPDAVKQGATATFIAAGTDTAGGTVKNYAFDLDGDGRFELDNGPSGSVAKRFDTAGRINVGVRVTDDQGGRSYADRVLVVQAPPLKQLLSRFSLDRPVFGGKSRRSAKVSFRLREAGTVTLALYRGDKRVKRYLNARARSAGTTYTQRIAAKGKRRGRYTVRISVRTAAGARSPRGSTSGASDAPRRRRGTRLRRRWPSRRSATTSTTVSPPSRWTSPTRATRCPTRSSASCSTRSRRPGRTTRCAASCSPRRTRRSSPPVGTSPGSPPTSR